MSFRTFDCEPYILTIQENCVDLLLRRFQNPDLKNGDVARTVFALLSVWETTGKKMDGLYFSYAKEAALRSGRFSELEFYGSCIERLTSLASLPDVYVKNVALISEAVRGWKNEGLSVGLKFGHYRRLTITQIFDLLVARKVCDKLVLCIESGERTRAYKNPVTELTDEERMRLFVGSGLVDEIFMTEGTDYSNRYYRGLVKRIAPSVLFMSSEWSQEMKEEYGKRAESCGAELVELPKLGEISTSDYQQYF